MPDREPLPASLAKAWGVASSARRRGPKAQLSLEEIADVAVELADERGRDGHSLSGVAERLGVTTNALYRYLNSRAELDVILGERALGPAPRIPDDMPWEDAVRSWVGAMRERHRAHPWLVDVQAYVPLMPNVLAWLDALLRALSAAGIDTPSAMWAASVIDGYVRAAAVRDRERLVAQDSDERALWASPGIVEQVAALARGRGMDLAAAVLDGTVFAMEGLGDDPSFEAGLDLILTGIAHRFLSPANEDRHPPVGGPQS